MTDNRGEREGGREGERERGGRGDAAAADTHVVYVWAGAVRISLKLRGGGVIRAPNLWSVSPP